MGTSKDRRKSSRQAALDNRAIVAWGNGSGFSEHGAIMLDISQSGALLTIDGGLRDLPATLWVRLDFPKVTDWAEATFVRTSRTGGLSLPWMRKALQRLHLKFVRGCPYDLYVA